MLDISEDLREVMQGVVAAIIFFGVMFWTYTDGKPQ